MRPRRLIIDGYSLLHRDPALAPFLNQNLMFAREQLIHKVDQIGSLLGDKTTIVFDGRQTGPTENTNTSSLEIIFSSSSQTADTVIERLVHADHEPEKILVVTSDRRERETVMAAGAQTMSCGEFLEKLNQTTRTFHQKTKKSVAGPKLGDYFPST